MGTIQANVPKAHLATEIGAPNKLSLEYSTEVLMPIAGPLFFYRILKDFMIWYLYFVEFIGFSEIAVDFLKKGGNPGIIPKSVSNSFSAIDDSNSTKAELPPMKKSKNKTSGVVDWIKGVFGKEEKTEQAKIIQFIQDKLRNPNPVFKDALIVGILVPNKSLFRKDFAEADISNKCKILLTEFLRLHDIYVPKVITDMMVKLKNEAVAMAKYKSSQRGIESLDHLPKETIELLVKWLVAMHRKSNERRVPDKLITIKDAVLVETLGFTPLVPQREWAFSRKERLDMEFQTPTIRGPVMAEAIPAQGVHERETYISTSNELMMIASERRMETSKELKGISISPLQGSLNSLYSPREDSVDNIVSENGLKFLSDERRSTIQSYLKEVSDASEHVETSGSTRSTSTTVSYKIPGVDPKLACTQHRFKVVTPVKSKIYVEDFGLTWAPRIDNPFLSLRTAARKSYDQAYNEFKQQYYVPKPVRPDIVWETIVLTIDTPLIGFPDGGLALGYFEVSLTDTTNHESPDLDAITVTVEQYTEALRFDSDSWSVNIRDKRFDGTKISGLVVVETTDGEFFEGVAHVSVPINRYSKETIDALSKYELELHDYQFKLEALQAQAKQYARIKLREFIERHERLDSISRILFDALIKRSLTLVSSPSHSYYKEIIARCIDWNRVKIEFEPKDMTALFYPDFPADHFMNSPGVRFFLPIIKTAEKTLIDTLKIYGNLFVSTSAESALTKIEALRADITAHGPKKVDEFDQEVIIGDHMEAVMSNHESAT